MRCQIPPLRRIPKPQCPVLPAQIQPQNLAAPPIPPVGGAIDRDRPVLPVHQTVAGQRGLVQIAPRIVKPPVFRHAHFRVIIPLDGFIAAGGAARCHFQHEIRRFPLLRDQIPVTRPVRRRVDAESHQQIGIAHALVIVRRDQRRRHLAGDDRSFPVAIVFIQRNRIPREIHLIKSSHLIRRRVGKSDQSGGVRRRQPGAGRSRFQRHIGLVISASRNAGIGPAIVPHRPTSRPFRRPVLTITMAVNIIPATMRRSRRPRSNRTERRRIS